jgi:hypothetical protein
VNFDGKVDVVGVDGRGSWWQEVEKVEVSA